MSSGGAGEEDGQQMACSKAKSRRPARRAGLRGRIRHLLGTEARNAVGFDRAMKGFRDQRKQASKQTDVALVEQASETSNAM